LHPCRSDANAPEAAADYAFVPHIRLIDEGEATGALAREYEAAVGRAGKVFNIVKSMSLNPGVLKRSMDLYRAIMFGPSELSRMERELLAVVVSNANDCHY
jgi:alkylhydroperoxidase family enzyme